jgi:drug/metabolite transporter (DMT)-like permease
LRIGHLSLDIGHWSLISALASRHPIASPVFLLLLVSFIWAFSFGLIKNRLAGVDPTAVAAVRMALAALVFLPFLRFHGTHAKQRVQLAATGAVQIGIMYILYLKAFHYLQAYEVALFTITTPIFITLIDAALERRIVGQHWAAAVLAVGGTAVIVWRATATADLVHGVLLIQVSNLCFALGQLAYRRIRSGMTGVRESSAFAWLYIGALLATALASCVNGSWQGFSPSASQWGVLVYLGVLSSGLCFFWWNRGATQVNAGTLAVLNNAKVPLGVACSLLIFREQASWVQLAIGAALLGLAVWIAQRKGSARAS